MSHERTWVSPVDVCLFAQTDELEQQRNVLEIGLQWCRNACRAEFEKQGIPPKMVDMMIKSAPLEPADHPLLKRIYEHCQQIKENKEKIRDAEAS